MAWLAVLALLSLCLAPASARARERMLRGLELHSRGGASVVRVHLALPMRVIGHSPEAEGSWMRVRLASLSGPGALADFGNELQRAPAGVGAPLEEVAFRGDPASGGGAEGAELDLRFDRRVRFQLSPGEDLRSLEVVVEPVPAPGAAATPASASRAAATPAPGDARPAPAAAVEPTRPASPAAAVEPTRPASPAAAVEPTRPASPADAARVDAMVTAAREALSRGELDRAIPMLEEAANAAPHARSAEARELLGIARERSGQRAHARAEYEAYLEAWPDGPDAVRVRQRLDALLTAADDPRPALREAREPAPGTTDTIAGRSAVPRSPLEDLRVHGSFYTSYSRVERESEGSGHSVDDSSFFHDVFARASLDGDEAELRAELEAAYLFDLVDGDDDWRVSSLFFEMAPHRGRASFSLGRLPGNRAGILGRFDGLRVRYQATPRIAVNAVGGMPFDPFIEPGIDPSRLFVGGSVETADLLLEGLRLELYAIQQWADGLRDRSGVGAEFSWTGSGRFLAGLLDYDVAFGELNTAFLVGTWQVRSGTTINALVDQRRLPTLTRRGALLGQSADSLDDLRQRFTTGEIDELALDRSVLSRSGSFGVTQRLTARVQLVGELSLSEFSGMPASGGVGEFPGSGLQVGTFLQLLVSDLLRAGDVVTVGVRNLESDDLDLWLLELHWRAALGRKLRVDPFLRLEHRDHVVTGGVLVYRPGLRVDYRVGAFNLDAEFSYGWGQGERFLGEGDEEGYFLLVGARWDF